MLHIRRNISLHGNDAEQKREEIREYFHKTYDSYEALFEIMANEQAYYERPDYLRHPLIFYYGHTAAFYINKLVLAKRLKQRIDPELESIFAVGVDEMSWDDLDESNYDWPSVERTRRYRDAVRQRVDELISTMPLSLPIDWDSPFWAILMGIEHENIHLETSSVLMRQLPLEFVKPHDAFPVCPDSAEAPANELLPVPGGTVEIGKDSDADFYGWDNEYGHHKAQIPDFQASKYLVSNGEFLEFVDAGGYGDDRWWEEEGRKWREYIKPQHPTFWVKSGDGYKLRTLTGEIELPLNWPAEVNYHEARAYCNWLGKRTGQKITLPTEDEWYRLYEYVNFPDEPRWGEKAPANSNLEHYASSTPVDRFAHGEFYDVFGNVWQWTQTPIYPFDGFKVHPLYDDFTTPTYDNEHNLFKGGSWISTGNETLKSSRYAFRRHFFQHAGFRYVISDYEQKVDANVYETDSLVSQYAQMSWGEEYYGVENFKKHCARIALQHCADLPKKRALDIGCAIGRGSFELAREFDHVIGIDYTARFIQLATQMKKNKEISYTETTEGELVEYKTKKLEQFGLEESAAKVEFWQGDACNLKPVFSNFDLIFATNLIDRLYDPQKFLRDLSGRLNEGGIVLLASPYSWDEGHTPKSKWLGGFKKDGENYTTFDGLKELLEGEFELLESRDVEFVIKETDRKFQHSISHVTVWKKR